MLEASLQKRLAHARLVFFVARAALRLLKLQKQLFCANRVSSEAAIFYFLNKLYISLIVSSEIILPISNRLLPKFNSINDINSFSVTSFIFLL